MSDKFLPDLSVGDFAMDILKSMAADPNSLKPSLKTSTLESANVPDISKVTVLVSNLSNLISEAKLILEEISSAGSPGTTTTGNLGSAIRKKLKKRKFNARGI
jgi:hypothetical protein